MSDDPHVFAFRPKARLLVLLGDQLIGNARLALFELVKNAYDADASVVDVRLDKLGSTDASITVQDDGSGMSFEDLRDIWLVPGADHKSIAKAGLIRSPKGRLPLGEKGLGRFAVHKLGESITLTTRRAQDDYESRIEIDWEQQAAKPFLADTQVEIIRSEPKVFARGHGTTVQIRKLRQADWTRGDVRRMFRQLTSICSPFAGPKDFKVNFHVPGRESDLQGVPTYEDILDRALWRFTFQVGGDGNFSWTYEFRNHLKGVPVESRVRATTDTRLLVPGQARDLLGDSTAKRDNRVIVDQTYLDGIGPVSGEFYVFDRDKDVLARLPETQLIRLFLDESGGVRVYRDGVRIYNYGEKGDDWLGLDLRRVNSPAARLSRNILVGAVQLSQERSTALREKTNREGFVDHPAYERLKSVVLGALSVLELERKLDKDRLRKVLRSDTPEAKFDVSTPVFELRKLAAQNGVLEALEPTIKKIEVEFSALQETMLRTGFAGLGLAVVFHEVERGVRALRDGLLESRPLAGLQEQAASLTKLFDGFAGLLRRNERTQVSAKGLVRQARDLSLLRFRFHQVRLSCPLIEDIRPDFDFQVAHSLVLGVLNNLLDNAFYWLRVKFPDQSESDELKRAIFIDGAQFPDGSSALVVADNGTGFVDPPAALVQPFLSRKPEGMGLGLYYAQMVMELSGGELLIGDRDLIEVPPEFDGAVVVLKFPARKTLGASNDPTR